MMCIADIKTIVQYMNNNNSSDNVYRICICKPRLWSTLIHTIPTTEGDYT